MWNSLPWFVRLAIDIPTGLVVLAAAIAVIVALSWGINIIVAALCVARNKIRRKLRRAAPPPESFGY